MPDATRQTHIVHNYIISRQQEETRAAIGEQTSHNLLKTSDILVLSTLKTQICSLMLNPCPACPSLTPAQPCAGRLKPSRVGRNALVQTFAPNVCQFICPLLWTMFEPTFARNRSPGIGITYLRGGRFIYDVFKDSAIQQQPSILQCFGETTD